MNSSDHFAQSYAEARLKFLAAAGAAGLVVQSHRHPLLGRDGETLAMDVARHGAIDAPGLLIVSSACHGVEGFCGSGVQNALLADTGFHAAAAQALFLTALLALPCLGVLLAAGMAPLVPRLSCLLVLLSQVSAEIPEGIDWILRVDGHTDNE
mgnify:CR=1 FL=1